MGIECAVTCPSEPKPEAYTHPITKPILHNSTQSPLARLPDKVLLNIMKHADDVSLLCLKRTCHTILQLLCTETQFLRLWDRRFDTHYPRSHTPQCGVEKVPEAARESLRSLLQRDMYCRMCRGPDIEARTKKLQDERLRCSGCKREHPAGMFSFDQRRHSPEHRRICIGREGYMPTCGHTTISWDVVEHFLVLSEHAIKWQCDCASHRSIFARVSCSGHDSGVTVILDKASTPTPPPPRCQWAKPRERNYPLLQVSWSTHISFPGLGKHGALEYEEALQRMAWASAVAGSNIFHDQGYKFPAGMSLFDPNICHCLRIPSPPEGVLDWAWAREPTLGRNCPIHPDRLGKARLQEWFSTPMVPRADHGPGRDACADQYQAFEWLRAKPCPKASKENGPGTTSKVLPPNGSKVTPATTPEAASETSKKVLAWTSKVSGGGTSEGPSERDPDSDPECIMFTYRKFIPLVGKNRESLQPLSASWFMQMHPESFSLRQDIESKGVYWCNTKSCFNYHKNHRNNRRRKALEYYDGIAVLYAQADIPAAPGGSEEQKGKMSKFRKCLKSIFR